MDEWEFMEAKLLRASRSGRVCITCQHFTYGTDAQCRTLLGCKLQSKQLGQGEHLTKKCRHWLTRRERQVGWCPEAA